jgi:hypothetical protein
MFAYYTDCHHARGKKEYFENDVKAAAGRILGDGWMDSEQGRRRNT